jgi:simple sugar transport system permease protein
MPASFTYLGSAYWFGFPVSAWVTIAVFLVAGLFLRYHRTGRAVYAIGGNVEAARAAGIKVDRIRIGVCCVAGVLAAIGGLMTAGQVLTVTANQGNNLIFTVFAAAVIGGIELEGGRGRMLGAFTGVVLLGLVNNVLVLRNTSTFWIDAVNGAIILIALGLARVVSLVRT